MPTVTPNFGLKKPLTNENYDIKIVTNDNMEVLDGQVQSKLISGTNIKTINGTSLLGSGNITDVAPIANPTFTGLITTGGQIKFPATQVPSADANTFDDYEKGTYVVTDTSGAGLVFTVNKTARYNKIGNIVFFSFDITFPTTTNSSGTSFGLPLTPALDGLVSGIVAYANLGASVTLADGFYTASAVKYLNSQCSGKRFICSGMYRI